MLLITLLLQSVILFAANPAPKRISITFWHSMAGTLGVDVKKITDEFNQSQTKYKVIPIYKGNYPEALTSTVAAFRAGKQPDIVQIFEVGTATMIHPKGVIVPVYKLMRNAGIELKASAFIPAIASYYSNVNGQLLAMPFNSSTPVMYYNKTDFAKAGLDPNKAPKTWPQMKTVSEKLLKAGFKCGFTTAWPSWIQMEAFSAWHNLPFATDSNGFASLNAKVIFNNPVLIHHISTLAKWQKLRIFQYGGREDNAESLFTSGQCVMLMESSGSRSGLVQNTKFKVGVAPIPYWPNVKGAPQTMLIGGASIWALSGHSKAVYQGIAEFFKFLSQPKIQAWWQQATGYLPVTNKAYALSQAQGYYKKNPGALVAIKELENKPPTPNSRGIRLGNYSQIRVINDQALESIWAGAANPTQALDDAVKHDNDLLRRFKEEMEN